MVSSTVSSPNAAPSSIKSVAQPRMEANFVEPARAPGVHNTAYDGVTLVPSETPTAESKRRTGGWKLFDFLVYGVVNFGGNVLMSFLIANKMYDKDKLGQDFTGVSNLLRPFHWIGKGLETKIFRPAFEWATPNKADQLTGLFSAVLALSWGGTSLLVPVKLIEDHKPKIVRVFDKGLDAVRGLFGGGPDKVELVEREKTYELLDSHQVKKSWGQAVKARLFSVGVGVLGGLGLLIVFDPKHKGIERLSEGYTKYVSPQMRKHRWLESLGPISAPEMAEIEALKESAAFLTSQGVAPGTAAAKSLLKNLGLNNAEASFVFSKGMDPAGEAGKKILRDIYTANKPAWNVSNMSVELSGSAITAGMFYVKMMFEELFGRKKPVPETSTASNDTSKTLAARIDFSETPAQGMDRDAAAGPQKSFASTVGKRAPTTEARQPAPRIQSFSQGGMSAGVEATRAQAGLAQALT